MPAQQTEDVAPEKGAQIILLGTSGGPGLGTQRSQPGSLLVVDKHPYLIDAGEGVARQMTFVGYQPSDVRTIFITHHHADHDVGLEPLLSLSWFNTALRGLTRPPVGIYGPPGTQYLTRAALAYLSVSERIFRAGIPQMAPAKPMFVAHDINQAGPVFEDATVHVTAAENTHFSTPSTADTGVRDRSYSYRFDTRYGSVVFTGDTGPSDAVAKLAEDADVLVSEVFLPASTPPKVSGPSAAALMKDLAKHMALEHLTPEEVGKLATQARVKAVILTHLVGYDPARDDLVAQVKRYYSGPVIVGQDLMRYQLTAAPRAR